MVILTGFYNAEEYIERALGSIMGQSYTDYTCYITHDLSTDLTATTWNNSHYDKILLDPPRVGAAELLPYIARWQPKRIV